MDAFYRAGKEAVKAADGLFKAMLASKSRSLPKPGKHVLDAAAAVSHDLVQSIYSVLLLNKDDTEQNEPPGVLLRRYHSDPGALFWHAHSGKATKAGNFI